MLAFERSERVSITTGTAKHKNVAGGDPMRSPTTLSGSPSATTGMVAIARGACHFTRYARFVARYHGLLNGHPSGDSLPSFFHFGRQVTQRSPFGCFATFFFPFWSAAYPTVTLRVVFWFYFAYMTLPLMKGVGVTFLLYMGGNSVFLFTFAG